VASGVVLGGVQATLDVFTAAPSGSTYGWKGYRYVYVKREDGTVVRGGPIKSLGNTNRHRAWCSRIHRQAWREAGGRPDEVVQLFLITARCA